MGANSFDRPRTPDLVVMLSADSGGRKLALWLSGSC
jgi:hypothetical protein